MTRLKAGKELIEAITWGYRAGVPVMLSGRHGVGKSELIKQAAQALGIDCLIRDLSMMEPPDLMGLPTVDGGRTIYAPPSALPNGGAGLLAIEELNRCPSYMLAPCLQLLTERRLNDYVLPDRWLAVASINPADEGYHINPLDPALTSRFVQVSVEADREEWLRWADTAGCVAPKIREFVRHTPEIFDDPMSNPRSWTYASKILVAWEQGDYAESTAQAMLAGTLGETWAAAFWQFYKHGRAPLLPRQLLDSYGERRKSVRQWIESRELELVSATVQLLKNFLSSQHNYISLFENELHLRNTRMFLSDLPGDMKRQTELWLREQEMIELDIPKEPL